MSTILTSALSTYFYDSLIAIIKEYTTCYCEHNKPILQNYLDTKRIIEISNGSKQNYNYIRFKKQFQMFDSRYNGNEYEYQHKYVKYGAIVNKVHKKKRANNKILTIDEITYMITHLCYDYNIKFNHNVYDHNLPLKKIYTFIPDLKCYTR
jgi:hypothetical protein